MRENVRRLRGKGKTYAEINSVLGEDIPKSTLATWCRGVRLPKFFKKKLELLAKTNIKKARQKALIVNREKRRKYLNSLKATNRKRAKKIKDRDVAKTALAMLCLGEASKSSSKARAFTLGSSDLRIVLLFLRLLEYCFDDFDMNKIRCTVQCRADQNIKELERYWLEHTGVPRRLFYKARIDPRTIGKKTRKKDYKGVLRVDYLNRKTQLDLETLANLIFDNIVEGP